MPGAKLTQEGAWPDGRKGAGHSQGRPQPRQRSGERAGQGLTLCLSSQLVLEKEKLGAMQAHLAGKMAPTKAPCAVSHPRPTGGADSWAVGETPAGGRGLILAPRSWDLWAPVPSSKHTQITLGICRFLLTNSLTLRSPDITILSLQSSSKSPNTEHRPCAAGRTTYITHRAWYKMKSQGLDFKMMIAEH